MTGHQLPDDFSGPGTPPDLPEAATNPAAARAIRCPACRREHVYEPPTFPCPCGAALKVPLLRGGVPVQVRFRSWEDSWLSMRCPQCGRSDQWPQPEFTCNCGATVRLPVDRGSRAGGPAAHGSRPLGSRPAPAGPVYAEGGQLPGAPARAGQPGGAPGVPGGRRQTRPPFRPHPIHSSQDAVLAAARYLEWLGFGDVELTEGQEREAIGLLGDRLVAQVDTWPEQADLRTVECLWLQTLHTEEVAAAMFTMSGYSHQATVRGEQLLVALFTLDQGGVPHPVNGAAEALLETGWTS
ncbi:hypothetical protein [Kitasatospora viridis]|uniref:hypothetical protein n=1 Tax=Kitasatospora viridis TaxID=281105 RepID=UPI001FE8A4D5|nr:hypothetical protein [Kitasatospora viridis]